MRAPSNRPEMAANGPRSDERAAKRVGVRVQRAEDTENEGLGVSGGGSAVGDCESPDSASVDLAESCEKRESIARLDSGYFCAGLVLEDDVVVEAAPIIKYMLGWTHYQGG